MLYDEFVKCDTSLTSAFCILFMYVYIILIVFLMLCVCIKVADLRWAIRDLRTPPSANGRVEIGEAAL